MAKGDLNGVDKLKNSALYYSVMLNKTYSMLTLLKHGADPNFKNENGNSALHQAFKTNNIQSVSNLLAFGADIGLENNFHQTPIYFGSPELIKELGLSKWKCLTLQDMSLEEVVIKKTIADARDYGLDPAILLQRRKYNIIKKKKPVTRLNADRQRLDIPLYINNILRRADIGLLSKSPQF